MPSQSFKAYVKDLEQDADERLALDLARARFTLGQRVRERREAVGLSQRALAAAAGVRQADVSRIEAAKANPTVETLTRLGASLNIELTFAEPVPSGR